MSATPTDAPAPRFSWPVRVVLFLVLFHMFFRSTDVLYPWEDWLRELKIERMPKPLPTREELAKLRDKAGGAYASTFDAFKEPFASLPRYWNPTPKDETLDLLNAPQLRWGGLRLMALNSGQREANHLPEQVGLIVRAVEDGSEADKAGLKPGDVIAKIDGASAKSDLSAVRSASLVGVNLVIRRDGDVETIDNVVFAGGVSVSKWDNVLLWLKYGVAWTASRLQWCECVLNIDQEWPMFSPNVGRRKYPARARLFYADGSEITIRQRSDPGDLSWYIRWSPGKDLGYDRGVADDSASRWYACPGWCNYLSHEHPVNEAGAKLVEIQIYQVRYDFPPPEVDPHEFFKDMMEKTRDHHTVSDRVYTTFFKYWPETKDYQFIKAQLTINAVPPAP